MMELFVELMSENSLYSSCGMYTIINPGNGVCAPSSRMVEVRELLHGSVCVLSELHRFKGGVRIGQRADQPCRIAVPRPHRRLVHGRVAGRVVHTDEVFDLPRVKSLAAIMDA